MHYEMIHSAYWEIHRHVVILFVRNQSFKRFKLALTFFLLEITFPRNDDKLFPPQLPEYAVQSMHLVLLCFKIRKGGGGSSFTFTTIRIL